MKVGVWGGRVWESMKVGGITFLGSKGLLGVVRLSSCCPNQ